MLANWKCLAQTNYSLAYFDSKSSIIWKYSVSSMAKFNSARENDNFWMNRVDHKDWLAPNEVLKVFQNLRDSELVIPAFKKISSRVDYKPSEALYTLLVDRFARAQKLDSIADLLDKAKCEKVRFSEEFFFKLIKIYGNFLNNPELAIKTLYRMPEFQCWPEIKTFNFVLNLLVCTKQFESIHDVFLSASRLGISPDTCSFNILIKALCQLDKLDAGFSLLQEISKQGLSPNVTTYSTLMHCLCKHERVREAFEVYERMDKEGCHPDAITFNILISGLCKEGRIDEGMSLLKTMKLKGCYPNSGTYQALLYGLLNAKQFAEAKSFMSMMISERRYPSFLSYKLAIEGLCRDKLMSDVDSVLRQMVSHGFVPRMGTWKKIVRSMFSIKDVSWIQSSSLISILD